MTGIFSRIFGRKKDKSKIFDESVKEQEHVEIKPEIVKVLPEENDVEDNLMRSPKELMIWLSEMDELFENIQHTDWFKINFMIAGEMIYMSKESSKGIEVGEGRLSGEDIIVRISSKVLDDLLISGDFDKFKTIISDSSKKPTDDYYTRINIKVDIDELNKRGYLRSDFLRMLLGI